MPRGGPRGGGRPRLGEKPRKTITVRVDADDLVWAETYAKAHDLSVSWLVALALAVLRKQAEEAQK